MYVPLSARGRTLGVITLVSAASGRRYTRADLTVAEDLAQRAALAIDNASLYRRAEEALRLQEEFLAGVTHDLKSPLATIRGIVSGFSHAVGDSVEVPTEWLRMADREADRLNSMVGDLLDMARVQAGAMVLDWEECYPIDIVEESVTAFRRRFSEEAYPIKVAVPADLPPVYADHNQLRRVLDNLLSNAATYSDEDMEIRVEAELDAATSTIELAVIDHGVGIPPAEQPHIFDRFYQGTRHAAGYRQGSGLGLAICRAFVEAHGGTIGVRSTPGQGSTFHITLPVMAADGELVQERTRVGWE